MPKTFCQINMVKTKKWIPNFDQKLNIKSSITVKMFPVAQKCSVQCTVKIA